MNFIRRLRSFSGIDALIWAFFLLWVAVIGLKYINFGYEDVDLAFFSQSMWNLIHGRQFNTILDINFLGNHANLIAYAVAPLFFVFRSAFTLLFLKILSFSAGGAVLYRIAKGVLPPRLTAVFVALYFLYPAGILANLAEFHFETVGVFFIFLVFYFFIQGRPLAFLASSVLLCLIKENLPLIVIAFGVYGLIVKREGRLAWGLLPIALGAAFLYIDMVLLMPYFRGEELGSKFLEFYGHLGETPREVVIYILTHPAEVIGICFRHLNGVLMADLFFPLGFVSVLGIDKVLLVSPIMLQHMLSFMRQEHTLYFHYWVTVMPFIFVSAVYGAAFIIKRIRYKRTEFILGVYLIGCTAVHLGLWAGEIHRTNSFWVANRAAPAKREALKYIPRDADVIAGFSFLPPLSCREGVYPIASVWGGRRGGAEIPEGTAYAIFDLTDGLMDKTFMICATEVAGALYDYFIKPGDWGVSYAEGDVVVLEKGRVFEKGIVSLVERSQFDDEPVAVFDGSLELLKLDAVKEGELLHVTFYWGAREEFDYVYRTIFFLQDGFREEAFQAHILGYMMLMPQWLGKDRVLREDYWLKAPGGRTVTCDLFNLTRDRFAAKEALERERISFNRRLVLYE